MVAYVCTVAGGKGGVGRTTTAINLGILFQQEGYETVVVDMDLAMANVARKLGITPEQTIHDVLAEDAPVEDALLSTVAELTICPGDWQLTSYADADASNLSTVVDTLRQDYDVVIVDTSAGLSHATVVPLGLADGILLVTTSSEVAIYDTIKTAQLADRVDGSVIGVLMTCVEDDSVVDAAYDDLDHPLLGVVPAAEEPEGNPVVLSESADQATLAYRSLTTVLSEIFFDGIDPENCDPVFDDDWFESDENTAAESTEEDNDSDDVIGLFK